MGEPVVMALGRGWLRWIYEAAMIGLAVGVVWLLTLPEEGWVRTAHLTIWAVFVVDYAVRIALSTDRRTFVRRNIPDLIAILPLDFLRVARLARLARLLRILRAGAVLWRASKDLRGVLGTNGLGWMLIVTTVVVFAGGFGAWMAEPELETFGDALWWSVVTATTVGYGDISPTAPTARVVAVVLMLVGIGTLGMITGSIATYFLSDPAEGPSDQHIAGLLDELQGWDELNAARRQRLLAMLSTAAEHEPP